MESAAPQISARSSASETVSPSGRKKSRLDTEAAKEFVSLTDQVLDGTGAKNVAGKEVVKLCASTNLNASPKTPPSKPKRKKEPSNSSIVSMEDATYFRGWWDLRRSKRKNLS